MIFTVTHEVRVKGTHWKNNGGRGGWCNWCSLKHESNNTLIKACIRWQWNLSSHFIRLCPDLVPVTGHCALALKGMLFRHRGAISFVSICCSVAIYCHHCNFKWQGNMGKKHGTDEILCRQVPVPVYGAWILPSERVPVPRYCAQVFVRAPLRCYVHIGVCVQAPNRGHQVWM